LKIEVIVSSHYWSTNTFRLKTIGLGSMLEAVKMLSNHHRWDDFERSNALSGSAPRKMTPLICYTSKSAKCCGLSRIVVEFLLSFKDWQENPLYTVKTFGSNFWVSRVYPLKN